MGSLRVEQRLRDRSGHHSYGPVLGTLRPGGRLGRPSSDGPTAIRGERNAAAGVRPADRKAVAPRAWYGPISPVVLILCIGLVAEIIVPWAAIWLSDALLFDIPAWSLWIIFGTAPLLTLLALLTRRAFGRPAAGEAPAKQRR